MFLYFPLRVEDVEVLGDEPQYDEVLVLEDKICPHKGLVLEDEHVDEVEGL